MYLVCGFQEPVAMETYRADQMWAKRTYDNRLRRPPNLVANSFLSGKSIVSRRRNERERRVE
jgi:hypothetical protein